MQISPSIRHTDFEHGDDFTNEFFDRRDLTGPSTARDKRVLSTQSGADYSEYDIGNYTDLGIAFMLDMTWESGLNILVGARYDTIDMESHLPIDKLLLFNFTTGFVIPSGDGLYMLNDFVDPDNYEQSDIQAPFDASDTVDGVSWTASVSWALPGGFVPYATASEQSTIIAGQGANISTGLIWSEGAFDTSTLWEVGIKGSFLDDTLYMALSVYEQERTDFNVQAIVTNSTNRTEGLEFETRWAPIDNLILTIGYSNMKVLNLNTLENGGRFSFYGADDMPQIDPALVYGGQVIGVPAATNESQAARAGVPENIFTFTGTYMLDSGLAFNASIVSAEEVFSGYSQAVKLPSYTLFNLGLVYETDNWMFSITGKNLSDERYFRANFPNLFGSQIVLPELPRHYQATASFRF